MNKLRKIRPYRRMFKSLRLNKNTYHRMYVISEEGIYDRYFLKNHTKEIAKEMQDLKKDDSVLSLQTESALYVFNTYGIKNQIEEFKSVAQAHETYKGFAMTETLIDKIKIAYLFSKVEAGANLKQIQTNINKVINDMETKEKDNVRIRK